MPWDHDGGRLTHAPNEYTKPNRPGLTAAIHYGYYPSGCGTAAGRHIENLKARYRADTPHAPGIEDGEQFIRRPTASYPIHRVSSQTLIRASALSDNSVLIKY